MKNKRNYYILLIFIIFILILGTTYAYFSAVLDVSGGSNDIVTTTGTLELNYIDGRQITANNIYPGWNTNKTIYVTNSGTLDSAYGIQFVDFQNQIINNELKLSLTCISYRNYGLANQSIDGTCSGITNQPVGLFSEIIKTNIQIDSGITHVYNLKLEFVEMSTIQNYNQGKRFKGTINIYEIIPSVKAASSVKVGDYISYDAGNYTETEPYPDSSVNNVFGGKTIGRSRNIGVDCTNNLSLLGTQYDNWRVLKIENDIITIVHSSTPECYKNHDDGLLDTNNLINHDYSEYVNDDLAVSAGILTKQLIEDNVEDTSVIIDSGFYENNQKILRCGTRYFIPFVNPSNSEQIAYVQPGGYIGGVGSAVYGVRPVVTLKNKVYITSGEGTSNDPYVVSSMPKEEELPNQNGIFTGYYENWNNDEYNIKLRDVSIAYNYINIIGENGDTNAGNGTIKFSLDQYLSSHLDNYSEVEFKSDIRLLQDRGQKVILVIGGDSDTIIVNDATSVNAFVNSVRNIIDEYGFDGIDIDIENTIYPTYLAQAINTLSNEYGDDFILTLAPQTIDIMVDSNGNYSGTYYELIQLIKDNIDIVNIQLYNTGDQYGLDGNIYDPSTIDFITSYADILYETGLNASQIGLGFIYNTSSSGYVAPSVITSAYNSLKAGGVTQGGTYTIRNDFSSLGGIMFFSINEDKERYYIFRNEIRDLLK